MNEIHSYPKVYNLGHPQITDLFDGPVVVQEKIDGSQISWSWRDGELFVRSKGKMQHGGSASADSMFIGAIEYLEEQTEYAAELADGWVFRGEWLNSPRHNTLTYERRPRNGLILFDIETEPNHFAEPVLVQRWAASLDIEAVRPFPATEGHSLEWFQTLLEEESQLGGPKVEGVVIKNYARFGKDGKALMGKHVSEAFKEKHSRSWKERHPTRRDIVDQLGEALNTEARWEKAVQHLRDNGELTNSPKDIGPLMREVKRDTIEEERDWIAERILATLLPKVERQLGRGLPEWYKQRLAESQFQGGDNE